MIRSRNVNDSVAQKTGSQQTHRVVHVRRGLERSQVVTVVARVPRMLHGSRRRTPRFGQQRVRRPARCPGARLLLLPSLPFRGALPTPGSERR